MPIDLLSEQRLSLNALASEIGVSISTTWRWCLRGIRGHKLECFSLGGRRYTTREAFARFVAATNDASPAANDTPRQRDRAIDRAEKELKALGV